MANVIATIVAKHFAQFSLAAFQGAILIQLFHLWLYPPLPLAPFSFFWVFVLELNPWDPYASCSPGCGLQIFLFFVGFTGEAELTFFGAGAGGVAMRDAVQV